MQQQYHTRKQLYKCHISKSFITQDGVNQLFDIRPYSVIIPQLNTHTHSCYTCYSKNTK